MGDHDSRHIDNTPAAVKTHVGGADPFPPEVRAKPPGVGITTMGVDVMILDSGEWVLTGELPALPWHVLIYSQRGAPANELHVWLPRDGMRGAGDFAVKRFWEGRSTRWCVEIPPEPAGPYRSRARVRFSTPDGTVLWSEKPVGRGLGDLSDDELTHLLAAGASGSYSGH